MTESIDPMGGEIRVDGLMRRDRRTFLATLVGASAGLLAAAWPATPVLASSSLQGQVIGLLRELRQEGSISPGERTSWCVSDLSTGEKLVSIDEDATRQAASMIKPFVAQAYFFQVRDSRGRIAYTDEIRSIMVRMIRHSSNQATDRLIDIVSRNANGRGAKDVDAILKDNAGTIFQQTHIVEKIPADGRTYRNRASAHDYCRFLTALWTDRLPYSRELREIMALPNHDRISNGVDSMPDTVRVYDKTGSTAALCGDMGIIEAHDVYGRSRPYIFVGIIERPSPSKSYGTWITRRSNAIRAVSNLVYLDMKERYRLA